MTDPTERERIADWTQETTGREPTEMDLRTIGRIIAGKLMFKVRGVPDSQADNVVP